MMAKEVLKRRTVEFFFESDTEADEVGINSNGTRDALRGTEG